MMKMEAAHRIYFTPWDVRWEEVADEWRRHGRVGLKYKVEMQFMIAAFMP